VDTNHPVVRGRLEGNDAGALTASNPRDSVIADLEVPHCPKGHLLEAPHLNAYCTECGSRLELAAVSAAIDQSSRLCTNGHELGLRDRFCASCGAASATPETPSAEYVLTDPLAPPSSGAVFESAPNPSIGGPSSAQVAGIEEDLARSGDRTQRSARGEGAKERLIRSARQIDLRGDAIQHGIQAARGALDGSGIAKVDKKTGKRKVRKIGVVKAAMRPTKTLRKAIDGATHSGKFEPTNEDDRGGFSPPGPPQEPH